MSELSIRLELTAKDQKIKELREYIKELECEHKKNIRDLKESFEPSPLPYKVSGEFENEIQDAYGNVIAECPMTNGGVWREYDKTNTIFIVKACNELYARNKKDGEES